MSINIIHVVCLLAGTVTACQPRADAPPDARLPAATVETTSSAAPASLLEQARTYRRPYGAGAPWNVRVEGLPRHPKSDEYVDLLWKSTAQRGGNFNLSFDDYTYPVYSVSEATTTYTVVTRWPSNLNGQQIPWNPDWRPAPGSDAQVIILDEKTGREWNLFQVRTTGTTVYATNGNLVPGDYRTRTRGFEPSRGIGIPYLAMLVRPEEIAAGRIPHALSMPARGTSGQFYLPPATKLEHKHGRPGIPVGLRFALDVTDAEIEAWLNDLPGTSSQTRRSARIIAEALRDYGWFITDAAGSSHIQFEANLTAKQDWAALGLSPRGAGPYMLPRDLLDGLVTRDRIYAIVPSDWY